MVATNHGSAMRAAMGIASKATGDLQRATQKSPTLVAM